MIADTVVVLITVWFVGMVVEYVRFSVRRGNPASIKEVWLEAFRAYVWMVFWPIRLALFLRDTTMKEGNGR